MNPSEKVKYYLERHSMSHLKLSKRSVIYQMSQTIRENKPAEPYDGDINDVESLVMYFLVNCYSRSTLYVKNSAYQCHRGARRSATDLYRLILPINPDITLFQVMRTLHKIAKEGGCNELYCGTVLKRVFWLNQPKRMDYGEINSGDYRRDEYGLLFSDWENIDG